MKIVYYYKIADVIIRIQIPFLVNQTAPFCDFLLSFDADEKKVNTSLVSVDFQVKEALDLQDKTLIYEGNLNIYEDKEAFYVGLLKGKGESYTSLRQEKGKDQSKYICYVEKENAWELSYARQLMEAISLEHILIHKARMILHASYIRFGGKSILFSAPSGTGKSTQADLWNRILGADIINGDRVALGKKDKKWMSYGIPFCGSSGISENVNAPLGAIVVLRQNVENNIRKLEKKEAFKYLYSETVVHIWDEKYQRLTIDLLLQLLEDVPVFLLECRPDKEAVLLLKKWLDEEKIWTH